MASEQKDDPQWLDKRAIMADPRIEKCTDAFLIAKGIKTIKYDYSFGIIPFKFTQIQNKSVPIYLAVQHRVLHFHFITLSVGY